MPWRPSYTQVEARDAISTASSWAEALATLGCAYHGKNIKTLKKWAARWEIEAEHLLTRTPTPYRYTEAEARAAIAKSRSWAECLRRLGYCHSGANPKTLKKRAVAWGISTDHFDRYAALREAPRGKPKPLKEVLVEGSTYSRASLKQRLYTEGVKRPECELCGQGELWRGSRIGLILDHINGVRDDNRIENLRIVCPNCAATLDTHCGRKNRRAVVLRECSRCGNAFRPKYRDHRYCSRACGSRWDRKGVTGPGARKASRPPHERLLKEIKLLGYSAVGRTYGVSDNAIRKWIRQYERERAVDEGRDESVVEIPTRTWPNRRRDEDAGSDEADQSAAA
jgi:transposase-like protein